MPPPLIGIARLAASAPILESKRLVDYRQLPSFQLLNRCQSSRVPFEWTINPYRGCEFACRYCYARYTHQFMELRDADQFDNLIFAKQWNPGAFRSSLRRLAHGHRIAIGTATDPYQPAERRFELTRSILSIVAEHTGLEILITTKSDLILRDLDLLTAVARRNALRVNCTVTTLDTDLARKLEPRAPRPDLRLAALAALTGAGIAAGLFCAPLMPLLNDSQASIDALAAAASQARAHWFHGNIVFLRDPARAVFLDLLDREFPHLSAKYRQRFDGSAYLRGPYVDLIRGRIRAARERHGLTERAPEYTASDPQFSLDFAASDMLSSI